MTALEHENKNVSLREKARERVNESKESECVCACVWLCVRERERERESERGKKRWGEETYGENLKAGKGVMRGGRAHLIKAFFVEMTFSSFLNLNFQNLTRTI